MLNLFRKSTGPLTLIVLIMMVSACGKKDEQVEWGIFQEPVKPSAMPDAKGEDAVSVLWDRNIGKAGEDGYAILRPGLTDNTLVVVNRQGTLQRLDQQTGKVLWQTSLKKAVFAGVGVGEGLALVALDSGEVVALDADNGEKKWTAEIGRPVSATPVAGAGRVVVRTADGLIMGLDALSGETLWQVQRRTPGLTLHGDSAPLIFGETVITGLSNGKLLANGLLNGRDYWETDLSFVRGDNELELLADADTPPVVSGARLFAANYQGDVVAVDLNSSKVDWRTQLSTRLPMAVGETAMFITSDLGDVVALDIVTGSKIWSQPGFQGRGVSNPVNVGARVLIGDASGNIHVLDAADGTLVQTRKISSGAVTALAASSNGVVAFSVRGTVAALAL